MFVWSALGIRLCFLEKLDVLCQILVVEVFDRMQVLKRSGIIFVSIQLGHSVSFSCFTFLQILIRCKFLSFVSFTEGITPQCEIINAGC